MGAKKIYDLAVKVGEYQVNGETKAKYKNIGLIMQKDDGGKFLMIDRTFNPAGVPDFSGKNSENILVSMFEPKDNNQQGGGGGGQSAAPRKQQNSAPPARSNQADLDDDIPFN